MISFPSLVTQGGGGRLNTRYGNHALIRLLCFLRFSVVAKLRDRRNIKKQTVGMGSIHMAFPQARFQGEHIKYLGHGLIQHSSTHCLHFAAYLIALLGMALTSKLCIFK